MFVFPFKEPMLADTNENVEISRFSSGLRNFTLSAKAQALIGIDTRGNFYVYRMGFFLFPFAFAVAAFLFDNRAAAVTLRTGARERKKSLVDTLLPRAFAPCADFRFCSRFCAGAFAGLTAKLFFKRDFTFGTECGLFKRDL